ncbi:ribonuclease P protein component [Bifidobacterium mongoliense]|uniref:ribonuclease P protein component n=1 Tax=Bifidobacterium mongoliense TaxID=518643 RepID=UPI0026482399|nr:ribonuclease P protein component [Bifidobacterium mongoliense]MDN5979999.1 ribonuclease P protein component [Bifidobacterium mongoliense]MDN6016787.1 ribonuclease P protein component [Bifidobacterium mongoliense]MDN6024898.1 ribonuclease P protein component [Bifidobacterium mongoliense]MDN6051154.1 ribonuclease P protein component [Bifidobacterium mongoliense]MDN6553566.1 ribonuclease P protein component [Bifidobacterium mongoliense]
MERLKNHGAFVAVLRGRNTVVSKDLVVHFLPRGGFDTPDVEGICPERRMGLAVSKAVGNAVTRNAVKRRFRVLARTHEGLLPRSCDIVMRARPSAARASFQSLDSQVVRCFGNISRSRKIRDAHGATAKHGTHVNRAVTTTSDTASKREIGA